MRKYLRFANGLRNFSKTQLKPDEAIVYARECIKKRVANREQNFLNLVQKGVFQNQHSPYLRILEPKRIGFEELKAWVLRDGIEASLHLLQSEGIYFTVDEFKGKTPVVRKGIKFTCREGMFDNPFLSCVYEVRSGATRSAGTRVRIDFDYLHQRSLYDALLLDTHGCLTAPIANWFPVFPGAPGINSSLRFAHIGNPVRRWFSQVAEDRLKVNWEKRWGIKLIFLISNWCGMPLAEPEYVALSDADKVARWAAEELQEHATCVIYTFAASAVRVCIAAAEANLNIKGTKFFVTGEPLTPQKKNEIEAVGADAIPVYGISEAGVIAAGCNQPHAPSDHCHLYKDTTAVITHRCSVPHWGISVDSYLFTSLLYESPKLLLNVGMGDYGDIHSEFCSCGLGQIGFDTVLGNIRSYEKLTGEGVTFVDTDFIRIIEKELPENFGGKSTDYQLVEEEDPKGLSHLLLLVSPRIGGINEKNALSIFMGLLKQGEDSPESWAQSGTEMWMQSKMVDVVREYPIPTASGKILPFHLLKPRDHRIHRNQIEERVPYAISIAETEKTPAK
jgi:CYTH domain-containing protein